ncbi:Dps family protein [Kordiimonas pumila]|uniref:Dps family protein n=1 Tax=Kordiimonas pumila TaxID=2161677 RepID=A0ABV7D8Q1_9PROT|nr:Dps family protein [Kordiimonas pumila]
MSTNNPIADALKPLLAETAQLYVLTQNVHWNVTGPMFHSVHTLTELQYTDLAVAVDDIAERIRALGSKAPGSYKAYAALGTIEDGDEDASAENMLKALVKGHEIVAERMRPIINKAADAGDDVTADLLTGRLAIHEKAQWMLKAMIA